MGVYAYACTCVSNIRGHSYYMCETQTYEYGTCWVVLQGAYSCSSIPLREIHKEKKGAVDEFMLRNQKKRKCFVNMYVCL